MRKSLFKRYLAVTSLIIAISFLLLSVVMIAFVSRQWQDEKRELLGKNATALSNLAGQNATYDVFNNRYLLNETIMRPFTRVFAENCDADIFITNTEGQRLIGEYVASGTQPQIDVPEEIVNRAIAGQYAAQTTLGGAYSRSYYVVAVPVQVVSSDAEVTTIAVVFASTSAQTLATYWLGTMQMFFWVAIATYMLSFCVVWMFSYKTTFPLRQMAAAAHSFGEGNFSMRINVAREDEIGQLAAELNSMAMCLSSSESMRRNFIANVSHELKTPMTTIAGFIDGILDGTIPETEERKYLEIVSQEVKRLSRLVKTMLNLSRIDSGEMKIRPGRFDLTETVCMTMLSFEKPIEDKKIEVRGLENTESLFVDGDPDMIYQVVYNLVENAVKFTNAGGYIEVRITDETDKTRIAIRNSGPGIAADEIAMVFDRFYKTDKSRSQDKNGMGLGLYIVQTIVRLHGGEISAASVPNEYTQFEFWLPKKPEAPKLKEGALPQEAPEREDHRKS